MSRLHVPDPRGLPQEMLALVPGLVESYTQWADYGMDVIISSKPVAEIFDGFDVRGDTLIPAPVLISFSPGYVMEDDGMGETRFRAAIVSRTLQVYALIESLGGGETVGYGLVPERMEGMLKTFAAVCSNEEIMKVSRPARRASRRWLKANRMGKARIRKLTIKEDLLGVLREVADKSIAAGASPARGSVEAHIVRACYSIYWVREPEPGEPVIDTCDGLHAVRRLRKAHHRGGTPETVRPRLSLVRGPK